MTFGLVRIRSLIQQFTMFTILRSTPTQSVLSGHRCVQHDMLRTNSDQGLSLDTTDACIVHKQPNRDSASCATTSLTIQLQLACTTKQGGKQQRNALQTASVSKREGTTSTDIGHRNLDYTSRFVRVIPILYPKIVT